MESGSPLNEMGFWRFWFLSLKHSCSLGWLVFGVASTALPAIITFIQHWYPKLASVPLFKAISQYQTEIQIAIAACFLLPYLFYAPYRLYRESNLQSRNKLNIANCKIEELETTQTQLRAELDTKSERKKRANELAVLMEKGRALLNGYKRGTSVLFPTQEAISNWTLKDVNPVLKELGMSYIARFNAAPDTVDVISLVGVPTHAIQDYSWLTARVKMLEEFIKEIMPL